METGKENEGRAQARQVLRIDTGYSASSSYYVLQVKDPAIRERYIALLRKAGLPE